MNARILRTSLACLALASATAAFALPISPADTGLIVATGSTPAQPSLTSIQTLTGVSELYEAYKKDAPSTESSSHPFADSYTTTFNSGLTGGTIVWDSPEPFISSPDVFLLVKDGNHNPTWYLFDLGGIWNGKETITLSGFWPGPGAISNVVLYSGETATVPDGKSTFLLIGLGLGIIIWAARRFRTA